MGSEHADPGAFPPFHGQARLGPVGGLGAVLAALPMLMMFAGFSVDDARIVSRVAETGAATGCFCFNPPDFTDAVTPLGFAQLVGFLVRATSAPALLVQSVLGLSAWALTVFAVGAAVTKREWPWLAALLAINLPLSAWAGAGLETPLVALIVTAAALVMDRGGERTGALGLGLAAAWRPELAVFGVAAVLARAGRGAPLDEAGNKPLTRPTAGLLLLGLPIALVAALRFHWFGSVVPLSIRAKEPALDSGLVYAAFALVGSGAPLLAILVDRSPWRTAIAAHFVALLVAGGDWMPLYRLAVPVIPLSVLASARVLGQPRRAPRVAGALGVGAAVVSAAVLWARFHERAPGVRSRDEAMIARVRPYLVNLERVASVDVGWVGAAAAGRVVDLGGVTDPRVAELPGGHTSRTITPGFFSARDVTGWVFRAVVIEGQARSLDDVSAVYAVDERLRRRADDLGFELVRTFERQGTREVYVLARYARPESEH